MNDDDYSVLEEEYRADLDKFLEQYDSGEISISECVDKNQKIAKKHTETMKLLDKKIRKYRKLKQIGWEEIEKRYKRDIEKISETEKLLFEASKAASSVEYDLLWI